MDNCILISCIKNPFEPFESQVIKRVDRLANVREAVNEFFPVPLDYDLEVVVSIVSGREPSRILTDEEIDTIVPQAGDNIILTAVPHGGGDDNSKGRSVAMMVVAVIAAIATSYVGGAGGWVVGAGNAATTTSLAIGAMAGMGVTIAGGLIVNALLPVTSTDTEGYASSSDYSESSTTYGWTPSPNSEVENVAIPVILGTHRVTPPLIGRYITTDGDKQYLNLLYAVAHGPVDSITDIEINENPQSYYSGITIETRLGTNDQTVISNFNDTISDVSVGAKLSTTYVTRQTTGNAVQGLAFGILFNNGLYHVNDSGGLDSQSVTVQIEYKKTSDTTYTILGTYTITASQDSALRKLYRVDNLDADQYDLRVCLTADPTTGTRYRNDCYFEYFQEILYDDFVCPGIALLSVKALATDQLSSSKPTVTCLVSRLTVPVWTGSAYEYLSATNPAWGCYNILHDEEYGGDVSYLKILYDKFLEWATWCTSKDYTCNIYFDSFTSLRKALDMVSILGRGNVLQIGSKWTCIYDSDALPTQRFMFTMGNIVKDSFSEEWLPMDDRANVVEVTYYDAELKNSKQIVVLEQESFDSLGVEINITSIDYIGCTNRTMAAKYGATLLKKNRYLTNTSSWQADIDAIACLPGDVIEVAHDVPQWGYSGRVVSATTTTITLDRNVTLSQTAIYKIKVQHIADDTTEELYVRGVVEETTTNVLTVTTAWTTTPVQYDTYSFGVEDTVTKMFKVVNITRSQTMRRKITALEHYEDVYNDDVTVPEIVNSSSLSGVAGLMATELFRQDIAGTFNSYVSLTWRGAALKWYVFKRTNAWETWMQQGFTYNPSWEFSDVVIGQTYYYAVSTTSNPDDGMKVSILIQGDQSEPDSLDAFTAVASGDTVSIVGVKLSVFNIAGYEIRFNGASWDEALLFGYSAIPNVRLSAVKPGTHTFWMNTVSKNGIYGSTPLSASVQVYYSSGYVDIDSWVWSFSTGTFVNTEQDTYTALTVLKCSHTDNVLTGTWTSPEYDLGSSMTVRIWGDFLSLFVSPDNTWAALYGETTTWDGLKAKYGRSWAEMRTALGAGQMTARLYWGTISGSLTNYCDNFVLLAPEITARYVQVVITIVDPSLDANTMLQSLTMKAAYWS